MTRPIPGVTLLEPLDLQPQGDSRPPVPVRDSRPLGAWLFRHRSWIPLPLVAALLVIPADEPSSPALLYLGALIVAGGEALRLWAVRHIGVISRTRSDRLGPTIRSGPFAHVRNPLYLGNMALWIGFAMAARLAWLAPIFGIILALEYHLIVRWEEQLLQERRGDEYRAYVNSVPRWIPSAAGHQAPTSEAPRTSYSWRETLFSERGTLIAIAVGFLLIAVKAAALPF